MPRYTPLYGLPALDPSDKLRTLADTDWANAQTIESILANQGQPPLGSDLQSLITRLNAAETKVKGTAQLVTSRASNVAVAGAGFRTISPGAALVDSAKGYNAQTGQYTVPTGLGGVWQITAALRFQDSQLSSGTNVAVGVDTAVQDGPNVYWYTAGGNRNSFVYTRAALFKDGDKVSLFAYVDTGGSPTNTQVAYSLTRPAQ